MKSKSYWKKRAEDISKYEFEKVDKYKIQLETQYQQAMLSIQDDIEDFYKKFADNNQITISDARKTLNSNELSEFKMNLKEFIKKAKDNKNLRWEKELNNVSYKVRVTRLQALQTQIKNAVENLYSKQQEGTTRLLVDSYNDTYYRNIFEIYKGIGIGINFAKLNDRAVKKVISEKWKGSNYSNRIWDNKQALVNELQSSLSKAVIRGDSIDKTAKILANRMNVGLGSARMLVNTESAYIITQATFDGYAESGVVKQYEILATLDFKTSKKCREMDGKVFNLEDKMVGFNAPPFHPNCRTTTIPYFNDAIDIERIARDSKGKNYYVDANIDFEEWYEKYAA